MSETYVTNITHYLDENGEIDYMPAPAKKLASFLVLIIDNTTSTGSINYDDTGIRCRKRGCHGSILSRLAEGAEEILWQCPICGHNGIIRNWQDTKWDRRVHDEC